MQSYLAGINLKECLVKAYEEKPLSDEEILFLLGLQNEKDITQLFEVARSLRKRYFGKKVFLYGFIYYSTWCRNDCTFCYYRVSNQAVERFRKPLEEVSEAAINLTASGVHLLDLTMGEDPFYYQRDEGLERLLHLVRTIKRQTMLPLMISPGAIIKSALSGLAQEGVDWFACYQETHNRSLYQWLRLNQGYQSRMNKKYFAKKLGLLIEEGILIGVGESLTDVAYSMKIMNELGAHQVRVMSFVPQAGTPKEHDPTPPRIRELKIIAVMRLLFPDKLIPASLDVDGINGLKSRMTAGANVVTSLIPPHSGLLGVSNSTLEIDDGCRTVQRVIPELAEIDLEAASLDEYTEWLKKAKGDLVKAGEGVRAHEGCGGWRKLAGG